MEKPEIEDCHRIGKKQNPKVITRFVNRKHCKTAIKNRKMLKTSDKTEIGLPENTKIFINENISPYFNHLAYRCRVLQRAKKISSHYFLNGKLYIVRTPGERSINISHIDNILNLYPDFEFDNDMINEN